MNPERFGRVREVFEIAIELPSEARDTCIRDLCCNDTELLQEVERMVEAAAYSDCPMDQAALDIVAKKIREDAVIGPWHPKRIGRYRILGTLGEGGMGVVYEAEQDLPRRTVALKVVKPGLSGPELLRRFEQESQVLGRLQHPGIAQIYEAGTADSGFGPQPYFAMELIRGESLLRYAETHHLNTRQRLDLMAKVCEAVHHAHQRGVIHRDLKPSNIVVDESGQPKILDFGVARVTNRDAQVTRRTDLGQLLGTLAYMSPEQALGDPLELDTRSDVYALGVILFELLAGWLPYKISGQLHEAMRTIREDDPAPLSSINRVYRGDIQTIVAKALEKDKNRRYASAADMAGDICRYLNNEPIAARPPTTTYQLQKFARRNKALVSGVAAVFVVLIAGIVASAWEARRAGIEAATAKALSDFLQNDLLTQATASAEARPDAKPDPDLKVRTALDRAASRIAGKFDTQPLVEASIRQTIGNTYKELGLYPEALRQSERALELRRRRLGEDNRDTLSSMNEVAYLYVYMGRYAQAEPLFIRCLAAARRALGVEHPDTLQYINNLAEGYLCEGKYPEAEATFHEVLTARERLRGPEDQGTLATMSNLALLYLTQGKYDQAEALFIKTAEAQRRVLGAEHRDTLISVSNLALVYLNKHQYLNAEVWARNALNSYQRVMPAIWRRYNCESLLGASLVAQKRYTEAEPLLLSGYAGLIQRESSIPWHLRSAVERSAESVVQLYEDWGKPNKVAEWRKKAQIAASVHNEQ